jgi:CRP-like cAMP-binding protein
MELFYSGLRWRSVDGAWQMIEPFAAGRAGPLPEQMLNVRQLGNRLLASLPSDVLMLLEPDFKQVVLPQGVVCFDPGDPIHQVYFPHTGMISCLVTTGDGEMVETSSVGRYGALGLQSGLGQRVSFTRVVVQIGGKFSVVPASRFEYAAGRSAALRDLIIRYTEMLWAEAQQNAACNAAHDGSSRLCRWLLQCADRIGSDQLPLTQEFLADMLGVRRTTVTLLAQELQKKGILRYSRGRITILDRAALKAAACDCYDAIKHDHPWHKSGLKL